MGFAGLIHLLAHREKEKKMKIKKIIAVCEDEAGEEVEVALSEVANECVTFTHRRASQPANPMVPNSQALYAYCYELSVESPLEVA